MHRSIFLPLPGPSSISELVPIMRSGRLRHGRWVVLGAVILSDHEDVGHRLHLGAAHVASVLVEGLVKAVMLG